MNCSSIPLTAKRFANGLTSLLRLAAAVATTFAGAHSADADIVFSGGSGQPVTVNFTSDLAFTLTSVPSNQEYMLVIEDAYGSNQPFDIGFFPAAAGTPTLNYLTTSRRATELRIGDSGGVSARTDVLLNFLNLSPVTPTLGSTLTITASVGTTTGSMLSQLPNNLGLRNVFLMDFSSGQQRTNTLQTTISVVPEPSPYAMALAGFACGGWSLWRRKRRTCPNGRSVAIAASLALVATLLSAGSTQAAPLTIDWVTVGDPGNVADINPAGNGAVADSFQIMKYELTNSQYAAFLNAKAATNPYGLYDTRMGSETRGGITQNGSSGSYSYTVKADMADKPVNYVSWFDAARVANWVQNGQGSGSTETGAYTLVGGQTSGLAPARNAGATIFLPTENEWYKAAYYKGGGTNTGYWVYATQSDSAPTAVTSSTTGVGSAGNTGNFANYNLAASWNGETAIMTSVGTNGGPSAYGAFDMVGNMWEWNDLTGAPNTLRGLRGGSWATDSAENVSSGVGVSAPTALADNHFGFRLAAAVVPEPSTWAMALAGIGCGGYSMWRRRKRA